MPVLTFDTYGKSRVRLLQVLRKHGRHEVVELTVQILLEGDFRNSYVEGDNSGVLPTDTMKNTVYAIARQRQVESIEQFALDLGRHFLARMPHASKVKVAISQSPWDRIGDHPHAFLERGGELRCSGVTVTRSQETVTSGVRNLHILKTADSAFAGYMKDEYTTLAETHERLLGTVLDADWRYEEGDLGFSALHEQIRRALLDTFAGHRSFSVQHTLYAMAENVLDGCPQVNDIHLVMPNKHCLLVDLSRFGLDNPNQVFVPTDEPSGYIEARIGR
ncbi:MAG: urate oxidase [Acidobacteriaceae bacterium]|nr:urate oxidase [Acidobacteriaceae bacterium]